MKTFEEITEFIQCALEKISLEQPRLNIKKASERAFCFRLGLHLNALLKNGYLVDSEYNCDLMNNDSKRIYNSEHLLQLAEVLKLPHKSKDRLAVPDFIIHKRTQHHHENLMVAELKFSDAADNKKAFDREKLRLIKSTYGYSHAAFIQIPRNWGEIKTNNQIERI